MEILLHFTFDILHSTLKERKNRKSYLAEANWLILAKYNKKKGPSVETD